MSTRLPKEAPAQKGSDPYVGCTVPAETKEQLRGLAHARRITVSDLLRELITNATAHRRIGAAK